MRLARIVHTDAQVYVGPAAVLIPDVADVGGGGADQCLLFVAPEGDEAHAFFFTSEQLRELARTILGIEVARVMP